MNYKAYIKREIEKTLFIEINRELTLNIKGNPILPTGEYPLLPKDVIYMAQREDEGIPASALIDGMLYMIACDPDFMYNRNYTDFLKEIDGIESYIILNIEKSKEEDLKKSIIYSTALSIINPKKEYRMNRVYLLMEHYNKTNLEFLTHEIINSLEGLCRDFPNYTVSHYHLGEYYVDKDINKAKELLRKCLKDPTVGNEAYETLEKIRLTEEYDDAVDLVKAGQGKDAIDTLTEYCEIYPENLDTRYYLAIAHRQCTNNEEALYLLNELTKQAERPEVYNEIGLNLAELNDFEAAREYFKKALKIKPDDSGIICNIGACHLNLGEIEEAKKTFELAERINPKDDIAKMWLQQIGKGI